MQGFIIKLYNDYPDLTPIDVCNVLGSRLVSETSSIPAHYKLYYKLMTKDSE